MTKIIIVFLLIGYLLGLETGLSYKRDQSLNDLINHDTLLTNIIAQQLKYEKDIVSKEGLK